jgi:hypothetical protein
MANLPVAAEPQELGKPMSHEKLTFPLAHLIIKAIYFLQFGKLMFRRVSYGGGGYGLCCGEVC